MTDYGSVISHLNPSEEQRIIIQSELERLTHNYQMNLVAYGKRGKDDLIDPSKPEGSKHLYRDKEVLRKEIEKLQSILNKLDIMMECPENSQIRVVAVESFSDISAGCTPQPIVNSPHLKKAYDEVKLAINDYETVIEGGNLVGISAERILRDDLLRTIKKTMNRPINNKGDITFTAQAYKTICSSNLPPETIRNRLKKINLEK